MSQAPSRGLPQSIENPVNKPPQVDLPDIVACVQNDLARVQKILRSELRSETPFVDRLLEHSWLLGGKRIRPIFLLLAGGAAGEISPAHYHLAAAVELVHTATLAHDDLLDQADVRRHQKTAFAKWGTKTSVLLGDYLFTHAFSVACNGGSTKAVQVMAQASNRVCEGEMWQNAWQDNFDMSETDYLRIISQKTAELCAASCEIGAILSGCGPAESQKFRQFGLNLGITFQIIDDVLDIAGTPEQVGKTLGTDLLNRKPTLPVIHCLAQFQGSAKQNLLAELQTPAPHIELILEKINSTNSIEYAKQMAVKHALDAQDFAESLPASDHAKAMASLSQFVLQRTR